MISGVTFGLPSRSPPIQDPKAQRRGVERQRLAERAIDLPHVARQRLPQRLLEHREAAADFVERRHGVIAHFVGLPDGRNLTPQRRRSTRRTPPASESGAIADGEDVGDPAMRLQQRAADDLGRMRREHQLDPQRSHRSWQRLGRQACGAPARERVGARTGLRRDASASRA